MVSRWLRSFRRLSLRRPRNITRTFVHKHRLRGDAALMDEERVHCARRPTAATVRAANDKCHEEEESYGNDCAARRDDGNDQHRIRVLRSLERG